MDASKILMNLLLFETPSGNETPLIEFLRDTFRDLGYKTTLQPTPAGAPNLIINALPEPDLVIATHVDTIKLISRPQIKNNKIYGTGSSDAKGSIASLILLSQKIDLPANISLVLFVDEEKGGTGSMQYLSQYRPKRAVIMEPTELRYCKSGFGGVEGRMIFRGRRYHPSISPPRENTIFRTMRILLELKNVLETKNYRFSIYHIACGDSNEYVVPSECEINFDIGVPPRSDPRQAIELIRKSADKHKFEFYITEYSSPFETNDIKFIDSFRKAISSVLGKAEEWIMPSWTDANNFAIFGIPTIVFGPGSLYVAHSELEEISTKEVELASTILEKLIKEEYY